MSADSGEQQGAEPKVKSKTTLTSTLGKPPLAKVFIAQCVLLALLATASLLVDRVTAYSVLLGGLIAVGPQMYFARWAFRFSGARAARQVAHAFYVGEAGKFVLTVVLFALIFAAIKPLNAVAIFLAYLLMAITNWFLAAYLSKYRGSKKTAV
jgi:ATP synthase protein I